MGEERSGRENGKTGGIGSIKGRFSRNTWIAIGGVLIGILFLAGGNILQKTPERDTATETVAYYTEYLEKRVAALCKRRWKRAANGSTRAMKSDKTQSL